MRKSEASTSNGTIHDRLAEPAMSEPRITEKVAFLRKPEAYAGHPTRVALKETHMSYLFLTDRYVWKLKKPAHYDYLDYSTVEARKRNCELEVALNRRLAVDVYLGVVPLVSDGNGMMHIGGQGRIIDWLVQMRRLPEHRMLDTAIASHTVSREDAQRVGILLARFYTEARTVPLSLAEYARRLEAETAECAQELRRAEFALPTDAVESVYADQMSFLTRESALIDDRVRQTKIVDAHGDLRPEHICLEEKPVVIDCLEFNEDFRVLDPASELAFLGLECDRLGARWVGEQIMDTYRQQTGDHPPEPLLAYYTHYHAYVRAKIAIWHLRDPDVRDREKWIAKAKSYLERAQSLEEIHK
jgi:uncharacterized protein